MAGNILSLALEIVADPSNAMKAIEEFRSQAKAASADVQAANAATVAGAKQATDATQQLATAQREANATAQAMRRTIAESLAMQGASAKGAAQVYQQLGVSGKQAAAEIKTAFAGAAESVEVAGVAGATSVQNMTRSVNESLATLRLFRNVMFSTVGVISFGFYIAEWARVVGAIKEGVQWMQGFDAEAKKTFADFVKGSDEALVKFQGLTTEQKIWQGQQLIAQTQQRINFDVSIREAIEAQSYWHNLAEEIRAVVSAISGNTVPLGIFFGQFGAKSGALADELKQEALLAKQHQELAQLEKQLQQEQARSARGVSKAARSQRDFSDSIDRVREHIPPFVQELISLARQQEHLELSSVGSVKILREQIDLLEHGFKTPAQLGFQVPNNLAPINLQIQAIRQLTEAERLALPTERELQLANAELARQYPNLTNAERAEWAQVMLTSGAYRKHIDESGRARASNAQLASSFNALAAQVRTAFSQMAGELAGWGGVGTRVFDQMFNAITRQIEIQQRQVAEHQIAEVSMTSATLNALKQLAVVQAIAETAKGFAALGSFQYWSAAQHFASAALWGTVTAFQVASLAGAFSPNSSGSKAVASAGASAGSAGNAPSGALASGSASAAARESNQQHTWQVVFNGPIYGRSGAQEIVSMLNHEVRVNRLQLVASHTIFGEQIR
jgi:hypothetical protein